MDQIVKFVCVVIIFLFQFLLAMNVNGNYLFILISLFTSDTIFYHIIVILLYFLFSLQLLLNVLKILIVQKITVHFLLNRGVVWDGVYVLKKRMNSYD